MTTDQMRHAISRVYPSENWRHKVDKMSDGQVFAIYQKFLAEGKLDSDRQYKPVNKIQISRKEYEAKYLGEFIFKKEKEEPIEPKEEFEQIAMDGFSFPKKGR